jgi:amino acid permease
MNSYEERRERQRRFLRQNLIWLVPVGAFVGVGLFIGLGFLVVWLWRVTLVDIFGVKQISFWQAWGLMLLCQILFKAHMQSNLRSMHARHSQRAADSAGGSSGQEV